MSLTAGSGVSVSLDSGSEVRLHHTRMEQQIDNECLLHIGSRRAVRYQLSSSRCRQWDSASCAESGV